MNDAFSLVKFRNEIRQAQNTGVTLDHRNAVYQVLGVYMYLSEESIEKIFNLKNDKKNEREKDFYSFPFLYDIVLSDGKETHKCLLAFDLGRLAQSAEVVAGVTLKVKKARCASYGQNDVIVLDDIEIIKNLVKPIQTKAAVLPVLPGASIREKSQYPLVSKRSTYLNVWSTSFPYGQAWLQPDTCLTMSATPRDFSVSLDIPRDTVKGLGSTFKIIPKPYPELLVKVLVKGKLHHYGTYQRDKPCPFQAYFVVGDHSGICSLVVWDSANVGTYNSLNPGDLIMLKDYLMKSISAERQAYLRSLPSEWPPRQSVELKVNYARNIGRCRQEEIETFHGKGVTLPEIICSFESHEMIRYAIADTYVDVVGMVIHASHLFRHRTQGSPDYCVYQWLLIRDQTNHPLWIRYYSTDLTPIYPNCMMAFQRLQVIRTPEPKPGQENMLLSQFQFLLFQPDSKIFYMDHRRLLWGPALDESMVKECLDWMNAGKENVKMSSTVGGIRIFPFSLSTFEDYFNLLMTVEEQKEVRKIWISEGAQKWFNMLKSKSRWQNLIEKLVYKEKRTTLFYGKLLRVDYVEEGVLRMLSQELLERHVPGMYKRIVKDIDKWVIPLIYEDPTKRKLMNWLKFQAFSAEMMSSETANTETPVPDAKRISKGVYILTLGNDGEDWSVPVAFLPGPNKGPPPNSLLDMLKSRTSPDSEEANWRNFENSKYMDVIASTAPEMYGTDYLFALDLVSFHRSCQLYILKQLYPLPSKLPGQENDIFLNGPAEMEVT